jgi:hypothetical protein
MGFIHADRVKETSTTTGTGTYSLDGATSGFRSFVAGVGTTNQCTYCATDGVDWEINEGVVTDATPDTLTRARLLASSTGSAISWAAGTRNIFGVYSAADMNPRTVLQTSDHAISSTTATEITSLQFGSVQPGTYFLQYVLRCQSATTTVGVKLGINFTGTAASPVLTVRYGSTGTTAATGVADDVANVLTGSLVESRASQTYTTTAPDLGPNTGFGATNSNVLFIVEGSLIVTAAGDIEIWHGSETGTSTTVKAGSMGILTRAMG